MKTTGIKVNVADKDAFIAGSKTIYDEFSKEVPLAKEVIARAIALGKQ
jgi:TRAP-type C4-dicarboxylate transport system substrate-binding protein